MPVQYEGVLAEHQAVRTSAGVFDVSHLGRFDLSGPGATNALRRLLCNDIAAVRTGRAQYTMALNEHGGVVDDIIVWRWNDDHVWVLPNGVNLDAVQDMFAAEPGVEVAPLRDRTVMLAVQGPEAPAILETVLGEVPRRFGLMEAQHDGARVWAGGTGYTGERGAEVAMDASDAIALWHALAGAGAVACGLGARDTLRLEMGYPLWGQDLDEHTTPLEAGLGWVVAWDHEFVGRSALEDQRTRGLDKQLIGFKTEGRQVPRSGYALRAGTSTGSVASGNFSPALGVGIGMGYLSPPPAASNLVEVEIRGRWHATERVDPPFISR